MCEGVKYCYSLNIMLARYQTLKFIFSLLILC